MLKAKIQKTNNILEAAKKIEEGVDRSLDSLIDFIFMRSQQLVPKDEGTLKTSAKPVLKEHLRKEVVYRALHARFVEFGTDPREKMPPVEVIERWVIRKGIERKGKASRQAAWAIAKFIQKRGTEPHPYLRPAANEAMVRMKEFVKDEVAVSISEIR
jgi:hypothetical protein